MPSANRLKEIGFQTEFRIMYLNGRMRLVQIRYNEVFESKYLFGINISIALVATYMQIMVLVTMWNNTFSICIFFALKLRH